MWSLGSGNCSLFNRVPYSFHICFRKYLFLYLFPVFLYSFLLLHKNIKTNVAYYSVLIPQRHNFMRYNLHVLDQIYDQTIFLKSVSL
jgi:hypothetical protein